MNLSDFSVFLTNLSENQLLLGGLGVALLWSLLWFWHIFRYPFLCAEADRM